jgi:hypothetical protein
VAGNELEARGFGHGARASITYIYGLTG